MATYIQEAFVEVAQNKSWLDLETKERVILKASKIGQRIGFPDELLNDSVVEEFYKGVRMGRRRTCLIYRPQRTQANVDSKRFIYKSTFVKADLIYIHYKELTRFDHLVGIWNE